MPDAFDSFPAVDDSGPPIAGFAVDRSAKGDRLRSADRLRQAWPGRPMTDAEVGLAPARRAGLGNAALPAKPVSDLPDAPCATPGKPANVFHQFDPDAFLNSTAGGMSDADVGLGGNQLPDAPWVGGNKPGMFDVLVPNAPSYGPGESALQGYRKDASANWRDEVYRPSKASEWPDWLGGFVCPSG